MIFTMLLFHGSVLPWNHKISVQLSLHNRRPLFLRLSKRGAPKRDLEFFTVYPSLAIDSMAQLIFRLLLFQWNTPELQIIHHSAIHLTILVYCRRECMFASTSAPSIFHILLRLQPHESVHRLHMELEAATRQRPPHPFSDSTIRSYTQSSEFHA